MENLKKWFNFSDTISGTTFLLRWLVALAVQFVGGYALGYGFGSGIMGLTMLGLTIASIGIVLQYSTLYKRSKAIYPSFKQHFTFYLSYLVISILYSFLQDVDPVIGGFTGIVLLVLFGIMIFKNSGDPEAKHLG